MPTREQIQQLMDTIPEERLAEVFTILEEYQKAPPSSGDSQEPSPSAITYDDVFRTLLNDCSELILPLLNVTFGKNYTGQERIIFHVNEHFIARPGGGQAKKRVTDSSFTVYNLDGTQDSYVYECQSNPDNTMIFRIAEYALQVGIENGDLHENTLDVEVPHCAVLFLRGTKNTPENLTIRITTTGGSVAFDVPVVQAQRFSLDDIIAKKLLFLIPFHIFSYEEQFSVYEADGKRLQELQQDYSRIVAYLDDLFAAGDIDEYTRKTILELSNQVLRKIAGNYDNVKKGVQEVMGGRILNYEAKDILNRGRQEGR